MKILNKRETKFYLMYMGNKIWELKKALDKEITLCKIYRNT